MSYPEYRITTIGELVKVATPENLPLLMADLSNHIMATKDQLVTCVHPEVFTWIDDGKNDVTLKIINDDWPSNLKEVINNGLSELYHEDTGEIIIETSGGKLIFELPRNI